jgi:hypothetical protein
MEIPRRFPKLAKIVNAHEKRRDKFQEAASKPFNERAEVLVKVIQKYIPEFRGCCLAMRRLYLYPLDLQIPMMRKDDSERFTERLGNILDYLDDGRYVIEVPDRVIEAWDELNEMSNYVDDNYSMVSGMEAGDPTHV